MKFFLNIILLSLLLFSCGKKTTITGRIINPVTGIGIGNIEIEVLKEKVNPIPGSMDGTGSKLIETTTTDSEGYYAIEIRKSSSRNYYLSVIYDENKYTSTESTSVLIASKTKNQTFNFGLTPYGFIKQDIHNINCFDSNDQMRYKRSNTSINLTSTYSTTFEGCFDFSSTEYFKYPMGWVKYEVETTKNGINSTLIDSFYLSENEYKNYSIDY